jgi:aminodeoxyfutalosine synthase
MPGGGAEIFDDRVHDEVFKGKVRADKWFDVHRTAHSLGIYTNATMLYGHVETPEERIGHMLKLRELQAESLENCGLRNSDCGLEDRTAPVSIRSPQSEIRNQPASFNCMIPLSFAPEQSELGHLPGNTGLTDLKTLAIARLMLDNVPHIKAFWIMQGIGLSQVALSWGCDDLDGTVVWYDITKREGEAARPTHQELNVGDIRRIIREAGRVPVERDTLYREVRRDADAPGREGVLAEPAIAG